jgi:hypothetical protein
MGEEMDACENLYREMRMRILEVILFIVIMSGAMGPAIASPIVKFPYNVKGAESPDGRYLVFNLNHEEQTLAHTLELRDKKTGLSKKVLDYGRHVEVGWSSDSRFFYVNDYLGSDEVTCFIVDSADGASLDLRPFVDAIIDKRDAIWSNHHRFLTCKSWKEGQVTVSLNGYGGANSEGFDLYFRYNVREQKLHRFVSSK